MAEPNVKAAETQEPPGERRFVTMDELCGEDAERDQTETFLPRYNAWIRHRTRVPLDMLMKAQQRYMSGKKRDLAGFFVEMLRYLMINPRVDGAQQAQALMKADGRVMLEIVNSAVGDVTDMVEEAEDEAGE